MKFIDVVTEARRNKVDLDLYHDEEGNFAGYMSSPKQQWRIEKMWAAGDGLDLVYMWVKQNHITLKEFKELVTEYTKE